MNATTNEATLTAITTRNEAAEATAGTRLAQNSLLSELPGIVFGLITLGYVISSLVALVLSRPKNFTGELKMNASTTEARFAGITSIVEAPVSEELRFAQYSMLNELPGAIFGVITVAYIVGSLLALAH